MNYSVSRDKTMKIWKLNYENKFECYKTITFQNSESDCNILKNKLLNLDIIKEKIITEINKLKETNELEIKFIQILFNCFENEENQNNFNYNVIENLKDFKKKFKFKNKEKYDKAYEEGNKYLLFQLLYKLHLYVLVIFVQFDIYFLLLI